MKKLCLLITLVLALGASLAHARAMKIWSFKELIEASDLIVIAEPVKNEKNADKWEWDPKFAQGITTTFHVLGQLKGAAPDNGSVLVKHFVYTTAWPPNGGAMVDFFTGPIKTKTLTTQGTKSKESSEEIEHPRWLIFLKKNTDGTYAPVTGQIDPIDSFRELHSAAQFSSDEQLMELSH